jgi:phosphopantothenoylcysteine decarboxylase/phosphopantothenate--cysteine ligase
MNEKMYEHAIVKENIAKLKKTGYSFVGPVKGRLACGHIAIGHIADTPDIVAAAKKSIKR